MPTYIVPMKNKPGIVVPNLTFANPATHGLTFGGAIINPMSLDPVLVMNEALYLDNDGRIMTGLVPPGERYIALVPHLTAGEGEFMVGD